MPTRDAADFLGGRACHHGVARHGLEHHGAGGHHGALADGDVAQDGGGRAYQHVVAHLGVPVAVALPRTYRHIGHRVRKWTKDVVLSMCMGGMEKMPGKSSSGDRTPVLAL